MESTKTYCKKYKNHYNLDIIEIFYYLQNKKEDFSYKFEIVEKEAEQWIHS